MQASGQVQPAGVDAAEADAQPHHLEMLLREAGDAARVSNVPAGG